MLKIHTYMFGLLLLLDFIAFLGTVINCFEKIVKIVVFRDHLKLYVGGSLKPNIVLMTPNAVKG